MGWNTAEEISEGLNFPSEVSTKEWLPDDMNLSAQKEGVVCLEHLIANEIGDKSVRMIEVGPIKSGFEKSRKRVMNHKAPIKLFQNRNPKHRCVGIGPEDLSDKERVRLLGKADFVKGLLGTGIRDNSKELIEKLGGSPDIVYGQHVFEHSDGYLESLPFGPYRIFERAAEILKVGGFIVVQNYGGSKSQIGMHNLGDNLHSKTMEPWALYEIEERGGEKRGIFVFKKTRLVKPEELAELERRKIGQVKRRRKDDEE
jgi:hypothetical protein